MRRATFDVGHEVLDHEVVDVNGVPCGIVDDVELAGAPGEPLVVVALLVGPGAAQARLPSLVARLARALFGSAQVRVPWEDVRALGEHIALARDAQALGLGRGDRRWRRAWSKVPGG
ncbi:MAG: hypothetical protein U1F48_19065 [Burkholderiales bacterium]